MSGPNPKTWPLAFALALTVATMAAGEPADKDWLQWGGPNGDFQVLAKDLADTWPDAGPPKLWSRELGDGYSTILVAKGRLYTMYRGGAQEAVVCLDAKTGNTIWETRYDHAPWEGHVTQFGEGPRSTPLISEDRLYTVGVAGRLQALDLSDGNIVWTQELWGKDVKEPLGHGYSSSPIAYKDTIIALLGGDEAQITAFHKKDGSIAWKSKSFGNTYSTPQVLRVGGQDQLVVFMAGELVAVDPNSGELLWSHALGGRSNVNMPIFVDGEILFASTLRDGARGLRLVRQGEKTEVEEVWATRKIQFYHVTTVRQGDWVYGVTGARAPHFIAAVNIKTGEIGWRQRGFAKANTIAVGPHLIILEETGELHLATATPEALTVHASTELLEQVAWTAPTIVGTTMYVRDKNQIMALDLGKNPQQKKEASS